MIWVNPETRLLFTEVDMVISSKTADTITISGDVFASFYVGQKFTILTALGVDLGQTWTVEAVQLVSGDTVVTVTEDTSIIGIGNEIHWIGVPVESAEADPTIRTIWQKGLNDEEYVPDQVDWQRRSEIEYTEEQDAYIDARLISDPSLTYSQAYGEWLTSQMNPLSETGEWVGDWEIPNQLYYNASHENRKCIRLLELYSHFDSIIKSQNTIPGFIGAPSDLFGLIYDVNYGVGGTIKEHNDSYDTLLSAVNVNNVTPISLFEFAHNQYGASLVTIKEIYRKDAVGYLVDTSAEMLLDPSSGVADATITQYEQNDALSLTYGDSSTYNEDTGLGIRNWIITLPYIGVVPKVEPTYIQDNTLGINQVIHHDGHRSEIAMPAAEREAIIRNTINTVDSRHGGTLGEQSTTTHPSTYSNFLSSYGTT